LVPVHSVTTLFAGPGVGKTLLALDFAFQAAACGKRVGIVEAEGAGTAFQVRLRRAREAAGGTLKGEVFVLFRPNDFSLAHSPDADALALEIAAHKLDLVVVDSLSALSDIDENDPREMRQLAEALERIKNQGGAAVLDLHHMTKEGWAPGQRPTLASLRGHGTLAARADAALALVPLEEIAGVVRFELWVLKQRDDQKIPPRAVEVLMTGPAAVVTSSPIDTSKPAAPKPSKGAQQLAAMMKEVTPIGEENAVSCNVVCNKIRKHKQTVLKAIKELTLVQNAELRQLPDERIYRVKAETPSDRGRYDRYTPELDLNGTEKEGGD
jgi:hypothetical protein